MKNFNAPYLSTSIKEFWSRWHISLSTWFRDYLYIPLGGNRGSTLKSYSNIFIVFLVSGLWHGANWTFVIWGFIHGTINVMEIAYKNLFKFSKTKNSFTFLKIINAFFSWLFTFFVVAIAWVFFRANNLDDALYIFKNIYKLDFNHLISIPIFSYFYYISSIFFIIILFSFEYLYDKNIIKKSLLNKPILAHAYFAVLFILIYVFGIFEKQSFIYFQF